MTAEHAKPMRSLRLIAVFSPVDRPVAQPEGRAEPDKAGIADIADNTGVVAEPGSDMACASPEQAPNSAGAFAVRDMTRRQADKASVGAGCRVFAARAADRPAVTIDFEATNLGAADLGATVPDRRVGGDKLPEPAVVLVPSLPGWSEGLQPQPEPA